MIPREIAVLAGIFIAMGSAGAIIGVDVQREGLASDGLGLEISGFIFLIIGFALLFLPSG